jgi:type IV pilus assembly protein PilV
MPKQIFRKSSSQRGFSFIEALVSLMILAFGILGLAQVQMRMLVQTRSTNARATAVRLISDLSDRIRLNATGAQSAGAVKSPYSASTVTDFSTPTEPAAKCGVMGTSCTPVQRANYDTWAWHQQVATSLMDGQANIFQISPRQLQIIVAWKAGENTNATLTGTATDRQVANALQITGTGTDTKCASASSGVICHIDFIDLPTL